MIATPKSPALLRCLLSALAILAMTASCGPVKAAPAHGEIDFTVDDSGHTTIDFTIGETKQ
ncbi:MAG: hypothetical protein AAF628_31995 [Planctomycetota bacterium]